MKRSLPALAIACLALLLVASVATAQQDELQLLLSRAMGFSLGNQIQGSFTLSVAGPSDLASVTYRIDGNEIATVTRDGAPFRYSFSTDSYALGQHRLSATARTASGRTLQSNEIGIEIVSASSGLQATTRIIIPIVGVALVIVAITVAIQLLPGSRKRTGYGAAGGAICPKCGRAFARRIFALNVLTGKLERCPYCGKWSITRPASAEALRAAEQATGQAQGATTAVRELTPQERLRRQIEDSRMSD